MTDQQTPAPEAGDVDVREDTTSGPEAAENTQGQVEGQPAPEDAGEEPEKSEDTSPSKARRERRKAEMERLRQSEAEAKSAADEANRTLEKIREAAQGQVQPKQEDFPSYDEYLVAFATFNAARTMDDRTIREAEERAEQAKQAAEQASQQTQKELAESWQAQAADAKARYADFDQVVTAPDLPISETMGKLIVGSESGADVAYYLGTNKAEAARISQMSDLDAARAIGAIEARLSIPQPKTVTDAPEPITPGKPKATATVDPSKMTMEQYKRARAEGKI